MRFSLSGTSSDVCPQVVFGHFKSGFQSDLRVGVCKSTSLPDSENSKVKGLKYYKLGFGG